MATDEHGFTRIRKDRIFGREYRVESGIEFRFEAEKAGSGSFWDTFRTRGALFVGGVGVSGCYSAVVAVGVAGYFVI